MGERKSASLHSLRAMHQRGERIAMLTCYDATFARVLDQSGVDCLLVGDSLGMVLQGKRSTLPVSLDDVVYHTTCVAQGSQHAWIIGDLPFGSFHETKEHAMRSAAALLQAGAHMVKLEGGGWTTELVHFLSHRGVPVCGHLGLTPQSVYSLGGWRIQGKSQEDAASIHRHAVELADAGAAMMVLELVPSELGRSISEALPVPVIGIGAGPHCSGQVLVLHDLLGLNDRPPRFVRNFMEGSSSVEAAVKRYVEDVKDGAFPDLHQHCY